VGPPSPGQAAGGRSSTQFSWITGSTISEMVLRCIPETPRQVGARNGLALADQVEDNAPVDIANYSLDAPCGRLLLLSVTGIPVSLVLSNYWRPARRFTEPSCRSILGTVPPSARFRGKVQLVAGYLSFVTPVSVPFPENPR